MTRRAVPAWFHHSLSVVITSCVLAAALSGISAQPARWTGAPLVAVQGDTIVLIEPFSDPLQITPVYTLDEAPLRERGLNRPSLITLSHNAISPDGRYAVFSHPDPAYADTPPDTLLQRWPTVIGLVDIEAATARLIAPSERSESVNVRPLSIEVYGQPTWSADRNILYMAREVFDETMTDVEGAGAVAQMRENIIAYDVDADTLTTILTSSNADVYAGNDHASAIVRLFGIYEGGVLYQRYHPTEGAPREWLFGWVVNGEMVERRSPHDIPVYNYGPVFYRDQPLLMSRRFDDDGSWNYAEIDPSLSTDEGIIMSNSYYLGAYAAQVPLTSLLVSPFMDWNGEVTTMFVSKADDTYIGSAFDVVPDMYAMAISPDGVWAAFSIIGGGVGFTDGSTATIDMLIPLGVRVDSFAWGPLAYTWVYSPG